MSRLVRWGPRAARVSERAVLASQASRAFSDSPKTEAPASAPEAAAKDDNEFKVSARAVDPRKTRTQLADEALYRTPMGKRVEELRKYTGLISNEAAVDPVLKETIRRNETAAASADMKKKAEWNKILASNISTDAKAKKLIAAGAPSHVVLNTLHFGKPRVVLRQVDRGNTDTQDYAALARDRFMEEFDASSYDYENSSDPDVLPRQRPFTRDEMHRILQDVEATRSKDAARAYEEQLLMPTSIMLHLANSTANMSLAHDAVDAAAGDMNVISEDPAGLSETIGNTRKEMYEAAELERRARVRKGVTSVSRGADAASTAQGVATLVDGAAGPVNSPAGARGIGSASVTHVVPATGVAGVPGHADAAVEAGTRLLGLAAEGSLGSLPVSAPTAPQDPRTPYGNVARPFANIFDEAAARAREITVEGFLNEKAIPANLRPPTMGEFNPHGIEYPFPKSYEGEKAWNESRPANLSADKDPMVRRVPDSILNGELEYAGDGSGDIMVDITSGPYNPNYRLPKGLTEAGSYREAIAMLSLPEYRGFAEKLSGLSREEQLERLVPLAQLYRTAMTAPPDGIDRAEVTRAKRRSLEAKRAAEHGQEWQEFAVNELDGEEKEESETVVLLREVNEFLSDYRPVSGVDPVADNDYRFGSAVSPFPANTSLGDVEHTLFSIAENDRFAAYYQQPVVSPTGDVEHLKMDQDLVSFDEVQRSEFAKAARKRNDPKVLQSIGSNRIRRFRKGMELYSGLPEHLLDYIDFHALPANDPRRVTHPLAVKLQRQIDELHAKSAPRSTEYSLGGSVAVHSDAEFADAGADDMPLSLVKATRESRARAALAATGKTAEEARMELIAPFSESDREMRIGSYVAHVLADNHLEFRDFESGFESEITRRKTLAATAAADGGDKDVRLVDATDGEVEPSYDVRPIVSLVDKIYGRESRLNKEIAAILSTLPAVQQSAVGTLYAADPAAAKRAIQQAIDRYTILAAIGSGTLDVPQDLLLERGLGRLKALIPPEVDFVAAAKAVATGKTVDGASGAGVIGSVLGTEAGAKADAQSSLGLGDGKDAIFPVHAAIDGTENPKGDGVFTNAIKYATEAARLEQVRKMLSARGLDSTGVRQRQRVAEEAARIEALDALAKVEAKRSAAKSDANLEAELRLPRDPNFRMVGAPGMPLDDVSKTDPLIVDAADFEGDEVNIRTFDNPLRPVPRAELGDDDPLARTLQDPVEYLPDHLAPAQLRVLYNDVERRIESAFFKNEISEADWNVMYQSVRAREVVQNMDNSDSEERDLAIFRREIVTGAAENSREQAAHRHQLSEHDTIINDYDMNRNDEVDDSRLHRASRLLSPYEILPVTDAAIPPFIAIEQQTHIYNLHKLDPSTFHPRWIAKRLNITPAAVVAMLKAQDLVHKSHLPARAEEVGTPFDSRRNGTMPVLNVKDERVLFPRTLDDLQIPYPPEQLLDATDVEGDLQLDAPHLIGRVSFDDDIFRDPAWQYEAYAPVRLVTDPEVAARTVEREEDRLNRLWARKDTVADAVEKASFAKFGPVHWASGQRTLHRPPKLPREIISRDLQPPSKHNWVLTSTDESFRSTFSIQVRDRDGYLRHPTFREFNAIRLRERDRRLAFFWRRHKVLAKLPEVSSAYVDNVMNAMMRTDGATKFGATVRTLLSETEEERDAISAAEGDVNRGIDLGEMAHVARLADFYLDLDKDASDSDFGLAEPENSVKVSKVE